MRTKHFKGRSSNRLSRALALLQVEVHVPAEVPVTGPFIRNDVRLEQLGITPRELNILEAMAAGLSNREIADAPTRPGSSPKRMIFGISL